MKKYLSLIITILIFSSCALHQKPTHEKIVILHTNDVHAGIDDKIGYAGLEAYKKEAETKYGEDNVILVDAGDAVQGASVAMLTKGDAIIKLMNALDYDYFVLGNHEFDYQIPRMYELIDKLDAEVVSSNFIDTRTNKPVYASYKMHTINDIDIAFVGVTTPESLTKASSQYFQDDKGNFIYTLKEDKTGKGLYQEAQKAIDNAKKDGAEYIVGLVHLGIDPNSKPWRSTDLIANTTGFDIVLDGHSHSIVEGEIHKDKDGNNVILSQTGTKLSSIGKVVIDANMPDNKDIKATLEGKNGTYTKKDPKVQKLIDNINKEFSTILAKEVAETEVELITSKPGEETSRIQETNLGNLVADAYKTALGTEVAIANGGGIRANVAKGKITYKDIINLHPFGNYIISIEASGQTIKDALEMGARSAPSPNGAFLQVSGITYEIDTSIPTSIKLDDKGNFISVNGDYRVRNIKINGKPIDENKTYTLASQDYMLKKGGDGMTMFKNSKIIKDMFMIDSEVLINYIVKNLNATIAGEYSNPNGSGRITIK